MSRSPLRPQQVGEPRPTSSIQPDSAGWSAWDVIKRFHAAYVILLLFRVNVTKAQPILPSTCPADQAKPTAASRINVSLIMDGPIATVNVGENASWQHLFTICTQLPVWFGLVARDKTKEECDETLCSGLKQLEAVENLLHPMVRTNIRRCYVWASGGETCENWGRGTECRDDCFETTMKNPQGYFKWKCSPKSTADHLKDEL